MTTTKSIKATENQTFVDLSIKYTGTADNAFLIASLNNMSVSDYLVAGMDIMVPITETNAVIKAEAISQNIEPTPAGVLSALVKHINTIATKNQLGHVRGGGNVKIDAEGRMWVELLSDNLDWDDITNKPALFSPSAHSQDWSTILHKPESFPPSQHTHLDLTSPFELGLGEGSIKAKDNIGSADGESAFGVGLLSMANGDHSLALGYKNKSNANFSVAVGAENEANGFSSTAMGTANRAHDYCEFVIGRFSKESQGDSSAFQKDNKAFVIGIGTDEDNRSNAAEIDCSGNALFAGGLRNGFNSTSYNNFMRSMSYNSAMGQTGECIVYANNVRSDITELFLSEKAERLTFPPNKLISAKIKVMGASSDSSAFLICFCDVDFNVCDDGSLNIIFSNYDYRINDLNAKVLIGSPYHDYFAIVTDLNSEPANYIAEIKWIELNTALN